MGESRREVHLPTGERLLIDENDNRVIPASVRPNGTVRKEIRIRKGYTHPAETQVYKTKAALERERQEAERQRCEQELALAAQAAAAPPPARSRRKEGRNRQEQKRDQAAPAAPFQYTYASFVGAPPLK